MTPGREAIAGRPATRMAWLFWPLVLGAATAGLLTLRDSLNEAQVALSYLLIVQLGAARHGRALGLTLAALAFVAFDVLFLPPYGTLMVEKSVDWVVLGAFLVTCVVTAHLFERSRAEADAARHRTDELDRLSTLGARTLNAPRAEDALNAIADVIRTTLDLSACAIWEADGNEGSRELVAVHHSRTGETPPELASVVRRAALTRHAVGLGSDIGRALVEADDASLLFAASPAAPQALNAAALPLLVEERMVGVLLVWREPTLTVDAAHGRMLGVLSYYAALGVERLRLAARAAHADALHEAARIKDAVLASVSHDLRTPLTTIKALAHELAVDGDERAGIIEDEADRLNRFVADLLDLSRLNAGVPLSAEPNEAEDLIGAALQRMGTAPNDGRVVVHVEGGEAVLFGRFDFGQTLRALVNVLENALKYSESEVSVDLSAARRGVWLEFAVADRGPGVPDEDRERIFEPFYRPARTAPDVGGAGLGLSIARAIARGQGGDLTHEVRDGGGSVFRLRVPFVEITTLVEP